MKYFAGLVAMIVLATSGAYVYQNQQTTTSVLFIGNSYTHQHDVPSIVAQIAAANGTALEVNMIAPGGVFLDEHAASVQVLDAIRSGGYDIVVLQPQSLEVASDELFPTRTFPAAAKLAGEAQANDSTVILYQTWARQFGSDIVGKNHSAQHQANLERFDLMARSQGASTARAGEAWELALADRFTDLLYQPDGSHATPTGAYLASASLARTIIGSPLTEAPAVLISAETAAELVKFANAAA